VDDSGFLFEDHLEARLPALGRETMGEAQLDENSMDFREGRAVSSGLVVTKMKARIGGGGAFLCTAPVGLEVRGSNRWGLRRGNIWGDG